jgi:hypothetical protein
MTEQREQSDPNFDYLQMLDEELDSCCMPSVKDVANASPEDIIRDLHRVLTGNGNATHGMIFKIAGANVNIRLLKRDFSRVEDQVAHQEKQCKDFQASHSRAEAVAAAEKTTVRRIGKAIWDNKSLILVLIMAAFLYISNAFTRASDAAEAEVKFGKILDKKIEQLVMEKLPTKKP